MTSCCPPSARPSAAAYMRHLRAGTVPCLQSRLDSAAYRLTRPRSPKKETP